MTISAGEKLPDATFKTITPDGAKDLTTAEIFAGKKVVLFGVPGAFTPTCNNNHLPGYLENYDAIGAWRDTEGELPIDSTGQLPDGRTFTGLAELRAILSTEREAFARALTAKLLTYALGRGLEGYDGPTVRAIARGLAEQDYRFSALVLEIVKSTPFQMRRGDTP